MISNNISIDEIRLAVKNILETYCLLNLEISSDDIYDENLLSDKIHIRARGLLQLYFEVESVFKIVIPENEVILGNFVTINNISRIIYNQITETRNDNENDVT